MKKERIEWVDLYKGILIFLVVLGHGFQGIASDNSLNTVVSFSSILNAKLIIYSFHMPAFFLAAGFFARSLYTKTNISYFKIKLRRLIPPYFIWSFITALAMQLASGQTNSGLGLKISCYHL